ncbi:MAG TPA: M14 family metallopeptidase [Actinomycetota bacterium]|nr:M14 family metallopeptidase [Actinomycetota bacterium]
MTPFKRLFVAALAVLLVAGIAPIGHSDTNRLMLVRVHPDSAAQAEYVLSHFDDTHNNTAGSIELLLWPGDLARLDALHADYDVVTTDLVARDQALGGTAADSVQHLPGPNRSDYRRLGDYNDEMKAMAKKDPGLVETFKMPRPSLEGRTIYGIEIAANVKDENDGRPVFYIDGVHHAREWPAGEYPMIFAHYLVDNYGKDKEITSLLHRVRVILVPIVNVDGFDYSRESLAQNDNLGAGNGFEGYWRKNRRSLTGVTVSAPRQVNPDAYGVDPNRNYAYLWGDGHGGSSGEVYDQTYRGDAPFSEPETQDVRDIILSRPVTMVLTNHTYQGSVLRTGGGTSPEDGILERLGQKVANILGYDNAPTVGYPTTGTTDDWAYAAMDSLGYTIEHGTIGFHPPYDQEVGSFWKQHVNAFMVLLRAAADPDYHSIIRGRVAGGPAKLTITKSFVTKLSPENPTGEAGYPEKLKMSITTDKNGYFEWHLSPSDRPYEKKPESFTLTIQAGSKTKVLNVHVERGQTLDLGTLTL